MDLRLRQLDLQALLQPALGCTLRQPLVDGTPKLGHYGWRDFEWATRTPFVAHAGGDSLTCHLLGNPADGIDMEPEHTRHFHTRRQLGVDDLGYHQPSRRPIVLRPLEERH